VLFSYPLGRQFASKVTHVERESEPLFSGHFSMNFGLKISG
jgi:hypothetical protein